MTLEHAPMDTDDDLDEAPPEGGPRLCACGCGEPLRQGAKRAYLRGHRARAEAENVDADPSPSDEPKRSRKPSARIQREVQDTIEAYLGVIATGWAIKDPLCGNVLADVTPNIAEKAVPLLARNPVIVKYLTKSSNFKEIMDLALAILPLIQVVYAHHMSHTISVGQHEEQVQNYNDYVA